MGASGTVTGAGSWHADTRRGVIASSAAFVIWGLFPLYLKPLVHVPATEILAHRIGWCVLFVFAWLAWQGRLREVWAALANRPVLLRLLLTALLITVNWLVYVWAISSGRVVEASLGYFIGPLFNVALGLLVLRESLDAYQWTAVGLAAAGVAWLTVAAGGLPWVALTLASSFAVYGLVRKMTPVGAVPGLAVEVLLVAPFAIGWLAWLEGSGAGTFGHDTLGVTLLLAGSGLITALPLALFATGARLIPYTVVGVIQYIGPTMQLLLGITLYEEPFPPVLMAGFALIWAGLAVFTADGLWRGRSVR